MAQGGGIGRRVGKFLVAVQVLLLCFVWVKLVGDSVYMAFHTTSGFDDLVVRRGVLQAVGQCKQRRRGMDYIPAVVAFDGKAQKIRLPCWQDVPALSKELGEPIEIWSDPHHLSFFTDNLNVWHISSGGKVYYDYAKAFERYGKPSIDLRVFLIITFLVASCYLCLNFSYVKRKISAIADEDSLSDIDPSSRTIYAPDNSYLWGCFSFVSVPVIFLTYMVLVKSHLFMVFLFPLLLVFPGIVRSIRDNKYAILVSEDGISYEKFHKIMNGPFLGWHDISSVDAVVKRTRMLPSRFCKIKVGDGRATVLVAHYKKSFADLNINPSHFKNGDVLFGEIVQRFDLYKSGKTKKDDQNPVRFHPAGQPS